MEQKQNYFDLLKIKMDDYAHSAYKLSKNFPKDELYGVTSQLRRSALSVILNYIEGFARKRPAIKKNFWEISYGSLKESKYLLHFSMKEGYITEVDYKNILKLAEEIGAMLWKALETLDNTAA
jgi:four helix bundle protein